MSDIQIRWRSLASTMFSAILAAAALLGPVRPAAADTAVAAEAEAAKPAVDVLSRVAVIGASATCGFGVEIDVAGPYGRTTAQADYAMVIDAMLPEAAEVGQFGNLFFFTAPMQFGPQLVASALNMQPTLVMGIDYLFWYGYGDQDAKGQPITEPGQRLELLEHGLKQLERFECPVVVGDYPDMSPAVGMMLGAAQLPDRDTLGKLNARLREWAKDHPNVVIVPLAELVASMQAGREVRIGEAVWAAEDVATVIQDDKLHPTIDGLVLMAQRAIDELATANDDVSAEQFQLDRATVLATIRTRLEQAAAEARRATENAAPSRE